MTGWSDNRIQKLFGIELPIIQAPMAGADSPELAMAVSEAGGLGSLACALLGPGQIMQAIGTIRAKTQKPINLNFFCHTPPRTDAARERQWREKLAQYYSAFRLDPQISATGPMRMPFDDRLCVAVETAKPEVVSFHFGLPEQSLMKRVKDAGAKVISSATTVQEARWLEQNGCDAIIAQGFEAGGHRGMFLTRDSAAQVGTFALVPQIVDAVKVPVIAAGGIADGRGIAAAFMLGASAVQLGTAFLFCPEAKISAIYRQALKDVTDERTVLTNVFSGRPARGIINRLIRETGPISDIVPDFPLAGPTVAPLRAAAEAAGSGDFTNMWSGQAARLCREMPAGALVKALAVDALQRFKG